MLRSQCGLVQRHLFDIRKKLLMITISVGSRVHETGRRLRSFEIQRHMGRCNVWKQVYFRATKQVSAPWQLTEKEVSQVIP